MCVFRCLLRVDKSSCKIKSSPIDEATARTGSVSDAEAQPATVWNVGPGTMLGKLEGTWPSDCQEGRTGHARPPDLAPFNIIKAKRCWRSKMGFGPRLPPKNPFDLVERVRGSRAPVFGKRAPRLGAGPKFAFRPGRKVFAPRSKVAFSLKASVKIDGRRKRQLFLGAEPALRSS